MALAPSKIFSAYRALGFVSNHIPLVTRYHTRHKDNYIVTCVGQAFHVYNTSKLGIVAVSDLHPDDISVLAADHRFIFTAAGKDVFAVKRNKKIDKTYKGHNTDVILLLPFGPHLISIDSDGFLIVWDISSGEKYLQVKFDPAVFSVTAIAHPHTYVNKILLGSKQGTLQLWNIHTNKLIYSFPGLGSSVTTIEQSTAIDVMAIGLADGQIILHNLAVDRTMAKFKQEYGPVTRIGFRTDGNPIMVTGSSAGHIALWNLETKKLHSYVKEAHYASVTGLVCLPSEPLMVTSAVDNSLKIWIFDMADGGARLLRMREGHSAPPTCIQFYGNDGQTILSAGQDSTMRSFSTVHDKHNKSLGRASYYKKASKRSGLKLDKHKMLPIIKFAAEPTRESDWDNIIACHRSLNIVSSWSFQRSTMGKHMFSHPRFSQDVLEQPVTATALEITPCGNFAFIGYSTGHVDVYNLQSGIHRGSYGDPQAHDVTVRGIACDALNHKLVTAGADGNLRFWRCKGKQLLGELKMNVIVSEILLHRNSSMLAVSLDDFTINIVDIDTRRTVRQFAWHSSAVTNMTFRADGRWLISASMDCTIATWNVPTGKLIDVFILRTAPTSISVSPCGSFLATTHVGDVGVYLWSNCTLYTHVSLAPLPPDYKPKLSELPGTTATDAEFMEVKDKIEDDEYKSVDQIADELVTLSLLPASQWLNLLNLDVIKNGSIYTSNPHKLYALKSIAWAQMRNKPKEPLKIPRAAPFFLPTVAGLVPKFDVQKDTADSKSDSHVKKSQLKEFSYLPVILTKAHNSNCYSNVMKTLKEKGPSEIDKDIRTLCADEGGNDEVMLYFLEFVDSVLRSNKDFELAHSYLALFLKIYGEEISCKVQLLSGLEKLADTQLHSWNRMQVMLQRALGLVTYLKSATV